MKGRVLIVAGSDSGGGAGIQADIKTVTALRGYAATALTALTAQDTQGVHGVHAVPPAFIRQQMTVVLGDIGADAIKIGMLGTAEAIEAVAATLAAEGAGIPVVVDPVMFAKGGYPLIEQNAMQALKARLILQATVLTPNVAEAEALTGFTIRTTDDLVHAALMLRTLGAQAVLAKGGHLPGEEIVDVLTEGDEVELLAAPRIQSRHTHGTGCTLASAIATGLAQGLSLADAVARARAYVRAAIAAAPGFGQGHGPLGHWHTVAPFTGRD